ncbi:MAG: GNAT family N-acetyltransferase [Bacteroidales bacterium]|nr:GNAT family N-acetyltransferase [Bacteroidales bacterium]
MNLQFETLNTSHAKGIISIEQYLWGGDETYRSQMFQWKYLDNPFHNKLTGVVATDGGSVVGFKGLVPNEWHFNGKLYRTVYYTDAVVDPKYRGHNILSKLNNFLREYYKNEFNYIIVLFPNQASGHIYKSQNVNPYSKLTNYKKITSLGKSVDFNIIDNIHDMFQIMSDINPAQRNTFDLVLTEDYLKWKLSEPNRKFVFAYSSLSQSYVIAEVRKKNIEIYDFASKQSVNDSLLLINTLARKLNKFYINIPLYDNQNDVALESLLSNGYKTFSWLSKFKKDYKVSKELLISPLKPDSSNEDFMVDGYRIDDYKIWNFKHLYYV